MSVNDGFIKNVYRAMLKYKPKLKPFQDDDEDFDIRDFANEIFKNYPWPIGVELRRLFSVEMDSLNRGRLDQILKTLERTMQYLSFVMICQLVEECLQKNISIPDSFRQTFPEQFSSLSMGNYSYLIRSVGKIFTNNNIQPFMTELTRILNNEFYNKFDFWAPKRNEIGHYLIDLTDEQIEVRCGEYSKRLEEIISGLAFLIKYPLLNIADIKVRKHKTQPIEYEHHIVSLNSSSNKFLGKWNRYSTFTDSHTVMIVHSIKNAPERYLSLSPLIIDTHFEIIDSEEKLKNIRKDVYLYTRITNKLHYLGTEDVQQPNMTFVSFYPQLEKEFQDIMQTLSSKGEPNDTTTV